MERSGPGAGSGQGADLPWADPRPSLAMICRDFLRDGQDGTQAMEYLLVIGATVVPCFAAILLLEDVLREYLEFGTVVLTSPFF